MKYNEDENNNGIVRKTINDVEYTFWTYTKVVRKNIIDDLKKRFPGKLIIRELNQVDLSIPRLNLTAEIQATRLSKSGIKYSGWENEIHKQIDQDIIYGKCLFFFDEALLKAMKNAGRSISINMDWFRKLIKEEKLEVYTITYDGVIEAKEYKDFDFLAEISQTCSAETDNMILDKNKMKIFADV